MWSAILCADWSKKATKREVYAAWPAERRLGRLLPPAVYDCGAMMPPRGWLAASSHLSFQGQM